MRPSRSSIPSRRRHFADWRRRYDYVLLLNADAGRIVDFARLPELVLVRDKGFAWLYRVVARAHG